jgi:hypothetical protein
MSGLVVILVVFIALAVLDILAQSHGVDSRDGFDDMRAPARGLS